MEYISDYRILGLPLYHIILQYQVGKRNKASKKLLVAKGIFAFGPRAFGVVSIGGLSVGLISLGGVAIASNLAYGAAAISREVAIGAVTHAKLMLYSQEYLQPRNLDEGAFKAFRFDYKIDFLKEFDLLYQRFGEIKKLFVHKLFG
jgi:hypothetical protein